LGHRRDPGVVADHSGDHPQIAAGAERASGAGDHRHARVRIAVDVAPDAGQLGMQALVGGVHLLGPVDRYQQHAVLAALEAEI
jgi:hypothetical protein